MNQTALTIVLLATALLSACDMRSETAKREMEKFSGTPTPAFSPVPTATPVDPADVIQVDTSQDGGTLPADGYKMSKTLACTKYNGVMINGDGNTIKITGACRRVMLNGDKNVVTAEAASEYVLNGTGNEVTYSKFVNGKQPLVSDNLADNILEHRRSGDGAKQPLNTAKNAK